MTNQSFLLMFRQKPSSELQHRMYVCNMYVLVCKNPCTSLENFVPQLLIPDRFRILSINYKVLTGFAFFSMPGIGIQIHVYFTRIFKVQYTE